MGNFPELLVRGQRFLKRNNIGRLLPPLLQKLKCKTLLLQTDHTLGTKDLGKSSWNWPRASFLRTSSESTRRCYSVHQGREPSGNKAHESQRWAQHTPMEQEWHLYFADSHQLTGHKAHTGENSWLILQISNYCGYYSHRSWRGDN